MTEYYVPTAPSETEFVEKRSRFIGRVKPVETEEEARAFVEEVRRRHHDARHNCWCYLLREGNVLRYSDDGEPQGTAGQPMLGVFEKEGVTNLVCVVTRYFGGVLLGAGGLVRAYTRSAKDALDAAGVSVVRRWVRHLVPCSYSRWSLPGRRPSGCARRPSASAPLSRTPSTARTSCSRCWCPRSAPRSTPPASWTSPPGQWKPWWRERFSSPSPSARRFRG